MATSYSEIESKKHIVSQNQQKARKDNKVTNIIFVIAAVLCFVIIAVSICFFAHNNTYKGEGEWIVSHDVVGTLGDFVGGIVGTIVALLSAYFLVRTLRNQTTVNSENLDANEVSITNSYRQIIDNNFRSIFNCYLDAIQKYHVTNTASLVRGREALEIIADNFSNQPYTDKRTFLSRVKSATNYYDELYSEYRHEMSVHFRLLFLLTKYVGDIENEDALGRVKFTEDNRVNYAKIIRGQMSDGELLLLRYNCLTERGRNMRYYVNLFNLTKHLPIMSLLEFKKHKMLLRSDHDASTLDAHFISLRKQIKELVVYSNFQQKVNKKISGRYSISLEIKKSKTKITLVLSRIVKRPGTGNDGSPQIEKVLNCFNLEQLKELYKDFFREIFIVSNFYQFNGKDDTEIDGTFVSDSVYDKVIVSIERQYPIVISSNRKNTPQSRRM